MEGIDWNAQTATVLAEELVEKFHPRNGFPWDQYDGVEDRNPNRITLLDLAVTVTMQSNLDVNQAGGLRTPHKNLDTNGLKPST